MRKAPTTVALLARPDGRRIVIVDYKPERTRKQSRSIGRSGNR